MTKRHLGHKVVDIDVDRKEDLLTSLTSAIGSLSSRKRLIETIQAEEGRKNEGCLNNLSQEKQSTLKMVKDRYDSLIAVVANEKDKSGARIKSEMTSLEESLSLLNNIKQYLDEETLSQRDVRDCEETIESKTERIDHILTTPPSKEYIEYIENNGKDKLVEELCGELMQRNHNKKGPDKQPEKLGSIFATGVKNSGGLFGKPNEQSAQMGRHFGRPAFSFEMSGKQSGSTLGLPNEEFGQVTSSFGGLFKQSEHTEIFGSLFRQPIEQSQQTGTLVQQPSTQPVKPAEKSGFKFGLGTLVQQPSTQPVKPVEKTGFEIWLGTSVQQPATQAVKPITQSGLGLRTSVQQPSTQPVKPVEKSGFGFGLGTSVQQPSTQPVKPITQSGLGLGTSVQQPSTQPVKLVEKSGFKFEFTTPVTNRKNQEAIPRFQCKYLQSWP